MSDFPDDAFLLASADNLDYIHSYARIYCSNQQNSWHGTTVQLVQPQPSTLVDVSVQQPEKSRENTSITHAQVTTVSTEDESSIGHPQTSASATLETVLQARLSKRRYSTQSPLNSPGKHSPLPKRRRRMRTGTEGNESSANPSNHSPSSTCIPNNIGTQPTLTIANFRLTGLSELAAASGYQPNSIGSNFKRPHNFQLEAWESMYRHFLSNFPSTEAPAYFQEYVSDWIKSFPEAKDQDSALRNLKEMSCDLSNTKIFKKTS